MSFDRSHRTGLGPRFGEIMGKHCHAAITAANKGDRAVYEREVQTIYQMLDTIETETWGTDEPTKPAPVAPESKPAQPSAGPTKKVAKGTGTTKRSSKSTKNPNKGSGGAPSAKRSGVGDSADTK